MNDHMLYHVCVHMLSALIKTLADCTIVNFYAWIVLYS